MGSLYDTHAEDGHLVISPRFDRSGMRFNIGCKSAVQGYV